MKPTKSKFHLIPIYDITFELVVCDDINKAHNTKSRCIRLGGNRWDGSRWCVGLCCDHGFDICIFLKNDRLTHEIVNHELMHGVQAILKRHGIKMGTKSDQETPALTMGYLSKLVYDDLKAWRIKIK